MDNHPDIVQYDIDHFNCRIIYIDFTADQLLQYIKGALDISFSNNEYEITETTNYEEKDINGNAITKWNITFYPDDDVDDFHLHFNYNTYYSSPNFQIEVLFSEGNENNFVELFDLGNSRTKFCRNTIIMIKYFITKAKREQLARYLSREQLLLFIHNSINNYDNFGNEDLKQINSEKLTSKKRRMLEDPMYQREVLQYVDNI
jgi:hypothetical protein